MEKLRVLIVDNDQTIQTTHHTRCTRVGFDAYVANNGKEAVDRYRAGETFDLVLMEMNMPVMDGPTATRLLRYMRVNSVIVGVSSRFVQPQTAMFMAAGLNDFFIKPLNIDDLLALAQRIVIAKDP